MKREMDTGVKKYLPMSAEAHYRELAKLQNEIDSVRSRADQTIDALRYMEERVEEMGSSIGRLEHLLTSIRQEQLLTRERVQANIDGVYKKALSLEGFAENAQGLLIDNAEAAMTQAAAAIPRSSIDHLDFHLTNHCNLNCRSCSVYSPLADKSFADVNVFRADLSKLHDLIGDSVLRIHLMGGEPLLHPNAEEFAYAARDVFRESQIDFTTNGLLVTKMPESFWNAVRDCNVAIKYTRYPVDYDYDAMIEYVREKGVPVFSAAEGTITCFRKIPLDPKGVFNSCRSYLQCPYVDCVQLRNGKLFHCPSAAFSDLLNASMKKTDACCEFALMPGDFLNLESAQSKEEILDFTSKATPFCRYCDMNHMDPSQPWGRSTRDIREWVRL